MKDSKRLIQVGDCYKPHGIKGGFGFRLFNREDSALRAGGAVILRPLEGSSLEDGEHCFEIADIRFGNKIVCYLVGVEQRDQAEQLVPFALYLRRSDFALPQEGEVYLSDIPGLQVRDSAGQEVGVVLGTYENGAQVVLEVQWGKERVDIPFVAPFVLGHDLEEGWIQLVYPEEYP